MRALIVGGGIAGPVVGMFLKRVGVDVICYEASTEAASCGGAGSFLSLSPNGLNVLRSLGIDEQLQAVGTPCVGLVFQNRRGEHIGGVDLRELPERYGSNSLVVRREALHEVLFEHARQDGLEIRFGERFVEADQSEPGKVKAHFESGHADEGNLLIGCDGIHSRTRQSICPGAAATYTGLMDVGGFARVPGLPSTDGELRMIYGRRAYFAWITARDGEVYWSSQLPQSEDPDRTELRSCPPACWQERLLELHARDSQPIADIVNAAHEIHAWPMYDIETLSKWSEQRICLVGDAAHATTPHFGQGASVTLEDAIVLAKCLRDAADYETAFNRYEVLRRARVDELVQLAGKMGYRKALANPVQRWVRDRFLPVFLRMGTKSNETIYSYRVSWQEA